jgi:hypothetical protein
MPGAGREIPGLVVTRGTGADRATMGDRPEVLVDSGFRCGSGIAAALTLGAGPCWPGRAVRAGRCGRGRRTALHRHLGPGAAHDHAPVQRPQHCRAEPRYEPQPTVGQRPTARRGRPRHLAVTHERSPSTRSGPSATRSGGEFKLCSRARRRTPHARHYVTGLPRLRRRGLWLEDTRTAGLAAEASATLLVSDQVAGQAAWPAN